jgi:hypothetical protein
MAKKINLSQVERFLLANDNAITKDEALDKIKKHPKGFFNLLKKTLNYSYQIKRETWVDFIVEFLSLNSTEVPENEVNDFLHKLTYGYAGRNHQFSKDELNKLIAAFIKYDKISFAFLDYFEKNRFNIGSKKESNLEKELLSMPLEKMIKHISTRYLASYISNVYGSKRWKELEEYAIKNKSPYIMSLVDNSYKLIEKFIIKDFDLEITNSKDAQELISYMRHSPNAILSYDFIKNSKKLEPQLLARLTLAYCKDKRIPEFEHLLSNDITSMVEYHETAFQIDKGTYRSSGNWERWEVLEKELFASHLCNDNDDVYSYLSRVVFSSKKNNRIELFEKSVIEELKKVITFNPYGDENKVSNFFQNIRYYVDTTKASSFNDTIADLIVESSNAKLLSYLIRNKEIKFGNLTDEKLKKLILTDREASIEYALALDIRFKEAEESINSVDDDIKSNYKHHIERFKQRITEKQQYYVRSLVANRINKDQTFFKF